MFLFVENCVRINHICKRGDSYGEERIAAGTTQADDA